MFQIKQALSESADNGDGTGGSAGGSDLNELKEQMEALQAQVKDREEEIDRLRGHSEKLLDEKKKIKATLDKFGDVDADKIQEMFKHFEGSEEARLLAEGKIDEVVAKRAERQILEKDQAVSEISAKLEEAVEKADRNYQLYQQEVIGTEVRKAAEEAGVIPSAIDDVLARSRGVFTLNEGRVEARDADGKIVTLKDKVLDPKLFVASLKDSAPHYWPASQSGGANGGTGGASNVDMEDRLKDSIQKGGLSAYRKLRQGK